MTSIAATRAAQEQVGSRCLFEILHRLGIIAPGTFTHPSQLIGISLPNEPFETHSFLEFEDIIHDLRAVYKTAGMRCLRADSALQKHPVLNLVRQVARANGLHLEPHIASNGYEASGRKRVKRWFEVRSLDISPGEIREGGECPPPKRSTTPPFKTTPPPPSLYIAPPPPPQEIHMTPMEYLASSPPPDESYDEPNEINETNELNGVMPEVVMELQPPSEYNEVIVVPPESVSIHTEEPEREIKVTKRIRRNPPKTQPAVMPETVVEHEEDSQNPI